MNNLLSFLLGSPVRKLSAESSREIFLTFDDGPDSEATDGVLQILKKHKASATFFVIAEKAKRDSAKILEISSASHTIGNHSLDHRYRPYFQGRKAILEWVDRSEEILSGIIGKPSVGFRPPAGIRTPELAWALRKRNIPMVLWNERFYDRMRPWPRRLAERSLAQLENGSIILLHDVRSGSDLPNFLETLNFYVQGISDRGFACKALTREMCVENLNGRGR